MKVLFSLSFLNFFFCLYGQEMGAVVSASGDSKRPLDVSWSLGELINGSFNSPSLLVSNGLSNQSVTFLATEVLEKEKEIVVFPNPFESEISVRTMSIDLSFMGFNLLDMTGRLMPIDVISVERASARILIKNQSMPSGVYFLKFNSIDSGLIYLAKLIKK